LILAISFKNSFAVMTASAISRDIVKPRDTSNSADFRPAQTSNHGYGKPILFKFYITLFFQHSTDYLPKHTFINSLTMRWIFQNLTEEGHDQLNYRSVTVQCHTCFLHSLLCQLLLVFSYCFSTCTH
jgi:hypothetical protein